MAGLRSGDWAWLGLAAYVFGYNYKARDDEMLSEAVDRYLMTHPLVTAAVALYVVSHLLNILPNQVDLFNRAAVWGRREMPRPAPK